MRGSRLLAAAALRGPKRLLALWIVLVIALSGYAVKLPAVLKDHGLIVKNGSFAQVERILAEEFQIPKDPVILLFHRKEEVTDGQLRSYIGRTLSVVQGMASLKGVVSPLEQGHDGMIDGSFAYAHLDMESEPHHAARDLDELRSRIPQDSRISVRLTGQPVVQADVNEASKQDLAQAEVMGLPAAFIALWFAFRSAVSALLPIVTGIITVTAAMGLLYGLGSVLDPAGAASAHSFGVFIEQLLRLSSGSITARTPALELSSFVLNVVPMVGLALSIDFALVLVSRFREELAVHRIEQALAVTLATAGRAVLYSAACVLLGLAGVLLIRLPLFTSVAISAMCVLAVSVLVTFTLLPSLLVMLAPRLQQEARFTPAASGRDRHRWPRFVMKRPAVTALLASAVLIGCLYPLRGMKVAIPDASSLPQSYASRAAAADFETRFAPPANAIVYFAAAEPPKAASHAHMQKAAYWKQAYSLVDQLRSDRYVAQAEPLFRQSSRMLIRVTLFGDRSSAETHSWLRHWEREGLSASGTAFLLGGEAKYEQEVLDEISSRYLYVLLFIVTANYMVLFAAFRSILIPLKAIAMNLLSLGAAFGILTWLFEGGHLGIEPYSIAVMIPVFIFGLVFGISMDYGVFLLSRIAEIYERTGDNDASVREGVASTGRMITCAAAILIAVTLPFAFGDVVGVRQLGVGIAAAIFIDATIVRMVLVPALMKLLGRWNWWTPV